jgi:Family of unknown function (DUF5317)
LILILAVLSGLIFGLGWARQRREPYRAPSLKYIWLVFIGFVPQLILAYMPESRYVLTDTLAGIYLSLSLVIFLLFAWFNRHLPGMPILIIGLLFNLSVMIVNGGYMPISPQTVSGLTGVDVLQFFTLGHRIGQKDVLLLPEKTPLEFLSDRFLTPAWFPFQSAFSIGDIFIAIGAFWLLAKPIYRTY